MLRTDHLGLLSVESVCQLPCPLTGRKNGCRSHQSRVIAFKIPASAIANPQKPSRAIRGSPGPSVCDICANPNAYSSAGTPRPVQAKLLCYCSSEVL